MHVHPAHECARVPMPTEVIFISAPNDQRLGCVGVGALFWKISFDLRRYRSLLIYLCGALTLLGGTVCFIDWWEGLPTVWKLWEGPFIIIAASVMLSLSLRIQAE